MKVLCICAHGNVRSVALAYLIKTIYKHEAIAVGHKNSTPETIMMLKSWADQVIYVDKLIGPDTWHNPFDQDLQHQLLKRLKDLQL